MTRGRVAWAAACGVMFMLSAIRAGAQCGSAPLLAAIQNPAPNEVDWFGYSVAVSGNLAVVGSMFDDPGGVLAAGSAYVFNATSGARVATLNNPYPGVGDRFGNSVAISGSLVVVGAYGNEVNGVDFSGSIYVFNAWTGALVMARSSRTQTLDGRFGYSVAISDNLLLVGEPYNYNMNQWGRAHVFDATSGDLIVELRNPSVSEVDYFGQAVAISGNLAVVTAMGDTPGNVSRVGTAYVFDSTSGSLISTINNPTPGVEDNFGSSVALSGNNVLVGAIGDDPSGVTDAGAAYLFDALSGQRIMTLRDPSPSADGEFGFSVAISGNTCVVATRPSKDASLVERKTYVFDAETGALVSTLTGYLGPVAVSGSRAVIGTPYDSSRSLAEAGNAYIFSLDPLLEQPQKNFLLGRTDQGTDLSCDQVVDIADLIIAP